MRLALYKAPGTLANKLIRMATHPGPYSHCEIVFSEALRHLVSPDQIIPHDAGGSLCYSSSSWTPRKGCAFENINLADGKWDLIDIPVDIAQESAAVTLAIEDIGREYDWLGLGGFLLPKFPHERQKRFCSEECVNLMQIAGLLPGVIAHKTSPNSLSRLLT